MQVTSMHFKARAGEKLADRRLQSALKKLQGNFVKGRADRIAELDNFADIRDAAAAIRDRALANLDLYLEAFEQKATAAGAVVHWAQTHDDVNRIVREIAAQHGVRKVVKSKSMVTEECGLNVALEGADIVAPVVHKTRDEVSDLFAEKHNAPRLTDIPALCREAREKLRPHFLSADMGVSGANFIVAETGSTLIVTNEGNGRMVTTLPKVHVAITGIEKVVPTLEDVTTLLRLLPRHGTGQSITNYTSVNTGPRRAGDSDGPGHFHVILVDAGRSDLLGGDFREMLRCIRCGACMNHCPVYQSVGGHAYGWVYPGPMGSVLTPSYVGLEQTRDLPNAATLCGQCHVACPVKIPLPELLRKLRERQFARGLKPWPETLALKAWGWLAARPALYALATRFKARLLRAMADERGMIRSLPFGGGWTDRRDFPAPQGRTFRDLYQASKAKAN
jgi:L-lactate dehydrogenase complex protein LldF